jgi:hypothetical protein
MTTKTIAISQLSKFIDRKIAMLKERILQYLDFKGVSKYECYRKTGITNGIFSKKEGLSEDNMLRFLSYYADINLNWLFTGQGEMLRQPPSSTGEEARVSAESYAEERKMVDDGYRDKYFETVEKYSSLQEKHATLKEERDALQKKHDALQKKYAALQEKEKEHTSAMEWQKKDIGVEDEECIEKTQV